MVGKEFLDFLNSIETARKELRCSNSGAFYRGHSRETYNLVPSIFRRNYTTIKENNVYVESFAKGGHLIENSRNSWEFLSIMQHHGIPTRLLDWSESLFTALFFALTDRNSEPHIWITNAYELNRGSKVSKNPAIVTIGIDNIPEYQDCFLERDNKEIWPFDKPVFLQIPWSDNRMISQKGFYTFHPNEIPMEVNCKKFVKCVRLDKEAIEDAIRFLEYSGINEATIFPDLDGFGRFMRKQYSE